jgi:hypothetical protein
MADVLVENNKLNENKVNEDNVDEPVIEEITETKNQDNKIENNKVTDDSVTSETETPKKDTLELLFEFCILNYILIIVLNLVIYFLSDNYLKGCLTSGATFGIIYLIHYAIHKTDYFKNTTNPYINMIYGIGYVLICRLHIDHHLCAPTFLINLKELVCEFNWFIVAYCILATLDYVWVTTLLDNWIFLMCSIVYISSHHLNYGWLKVNDVHSIHHEQVLTNFGPSIFDILFNTYNPLTVIEDSTNVIPNMIISSVLVYLMKWAWNNNSEYQIILKRMLTIFLIVVLILNIGLYKNDKKQEK